MAEQCALNPSDTPEAQLVTPRYAADSGAPDAGIQVHHWEQQTLGVVLQPDCRLAKRVEYLYKSIKYHFYSSMQKSGERVKQEEMLQNVPQHRALNKADSTNTDSTSKIHKRKSRLAYLKERILAAPSGHLLA